MDINNKHELCSICKKEYTSIYTEASPGVKIYVCNHCLETAKENFIFICLNCGKTYLRLKKMLIEKISNFELKQAYILCEDMQIIQGIDMCIECDPEGILNYMEVQTTAEC